MRNYSMQHVRLAVFSLVAAAACASQPAPAPARPVTASVPEFYTGESVVTAMHDRYAGRWYKTLTFKQKTSRLMPDSTWSAQTWYEALSLPGKLRIDFDPVSAGNGVLFVRDSQFAVTNGRVTRSGPGINDLLLLGFDVYANAPAHTAELLQKEGFDLTRVHADTFQNRPMVVVGANAGDLHRKQFWVDAERLLFVRILEPTPRDTTKTQDIRFLNYEPRGSAWVSPRVEIHTGGKLVFTEDYTDMRTDVPLDENLFDPSKWKTAKHWMTP